MEETVIILDSAHLLLRVGVILSSISLYFFLAVLILSKKFHNLPGRNLLSYCVSKIFVVTLHSLGLMEKDYYDNKYFVKSMKYSFFCMYTWNVLIAYDVWRTVRISSTEFLIVSGNRWRRFLIYSTLGWILPFFMNMSETILWMPMDYYLMKKSLEYPNLSTVFTDFTFHLFIFAFISNIFFSSGSLYYIWRNYKSIHNMNSSNNSSGISFIVNFGLPLKVLMFGGYSSLLGALLFFFGSTKVVFYFSVAYSYQGVFITFLFIYGRNVFECINVGKNYSE